MFKKVCFVLSCLFVAVLSINDFVLAGAPSPPSGEKNFYVTNTNASGVGSLAQAFSDMNSANYNINNIVFTAGAKGRVNVSTTLFIYKPFVNFVNNSGGDIILYQNRTNSTKAYNYITKLNSMGTSINYGKNISFDVTDSFASFTYAIGAEWNDLNIHNGVYSDINIINTSNAARAIYAGGNLTINGGIDADFYVSSVSKNNRILFATEDITVNGDVKGNWTGISRDADSYGVFASDKIFINGEFAANMDLTSVNSAVYGFFSREDTNVSPSAITITGPVSGNINVTSQEAFAIGIYAEKGTINGGNADTPLAITGNIVAKGKTGACGVASLDKMNLIVTGKIEAVDTSGGGNAYAIRAGTNLMGVTRSADDKVVVDGGTVIGKVDLGAGTDTFIIKNNAVIRCEFINIENFQKIGGGSWNLKDDFNIPGLPLTISEGRASVNANLTAGSLTIGSSAVLGGSGQINAPVTTFGDFAPGNSVGTLTINGDVTVNGGNYELEVDPSGNDLLIVNGNMTINNGDTVNVVIEEGYFAGYQPDLKFIEAQSLIGNYSRYVSNNPSLTFRGVQKGNNLHAVATRIPYSDRAAYLGDDRNKSVLRGIDNTTVNPIEQSKDVLGKMDFMTASDLAEFSNKLTPLKYNAFTESLFSVMDIFKRDKESRLNYLRNDNPVGAYFTLIRKEDEFEINEPNSDFSPVSHGINIGRDFEMGDRFKAGLGVSYVDTDIDYSGAMVSKAEQNTIIVGTYGTYDFNDRWYIDSSFEGGTTKNIHTRRIFQAGTYFNSATPYSINEELTSEYRSDFVGLSLETGYLFELPYAVKVTPIVSLDASYINNENFSEMSSSVLALKLKGLDEENISCGLGTVLSKEFKLQNEMVLLPQITLKWLHNFSDSSRDIAASFKDMPGSDFIVSTPSREKNGVLLDFGFSIKAKDNIALKIGCAGYFASDRKSSDISLECNLKF